MNRKKFLTTGLALLIGSGAIAGNGALMYGVLAANDFSDKNIGVNDVNDEAIIENADYTSEQRLASTVSESDFAGNGTLTYSIVPSSEFSNKNIDVNADNTSEQTTTYTTVSGEEFANHEGINFSVMQDDADGNVYLVQVDDLENSTITTNKENSTSKNKKYIYQEGTPTKSDLTEAKAKEKAISTIKEKFNLSQDTLKRFDITTKFYSIYEDYDNAPLWWVNFYPSTPEEFMEIGCYTALIKASTGEVIKVLTANDGRG